MFVLSIKIHLSSEEMEKECHSEDPWRNSHYQNHSVPISSKDVDSYFLSKFGPYTTAIERVAHSIFIPSETSWNQAKFQLRSLPLTDVLCLYEYLSQLKFTLWKCPPSGIDRWTKQSNDDAFLTNLFFPSDLEVICDDYLVSYQKSHVMHALFWCAKRYHILAIAHLCSILRIINRPDMCEIQKMFLQVCNLEYETIVAAFYRGEKITVSIASLSKLGQFCRFE
jgi:hypothetical protein